MRLAGLLGLSALLLGCKPKLPPLEFHSERVAVGSDVVDRVCEGTLARLDREVEQVESRLGLEPKAERLKVYVMSPEVVETYCEPLNCFVREDLDDPFLMIRPAYFDGVIAHELVHARLGRRHGAAPLIGEGVAEAASPTSCPLAVPGDLDEDDYLGARTSIALAELSRGYYLAGEFVAWLLENEGSTAVVDLHTDIGQGADPNWIRAEYQKRFGREIEEDLFTHVRTQDDLAALPPEHFGCLGLSAPVKDGVVHLEAELDCGSDLVQNSFGMQDRGYVEWTLALEVDQRFDRIGTVPESTALTIQECACVPKKDGNSYLLPRAFDEHETYRAGTYRLRWDGKLDEGLAIDIELRPAD